MHWIYCRNLAICPTWVAPHGWPRDTEKGLSALTSIYGDLEITGNSALTDLDGLGGLTSIYGDLLIYSNPALTNIDGLSGITSVRGDTWGLGIRNNNALTNLDGLSGVSLVSTAIVIYNNDVLTDIDGLGGITSVGSGVLAYWNEALPDCEVCDLLDQFSTAGPYFGIDVHDNLDDECTPVPTNCP